MSEFIIAIVMFCNTQPNINECQKSVLRCTQAVTGTGEYFKTYLPNCIEKQLDKKVKP